jgi:hypothetical protein
MIANLKSVSHDRPFSSLRRLQPELDQPAYGFSPGRQIVLRTPPGIQPPGAPPDTDAELIALAKALAEQRDVADMIAAEAKTLPPLATAASKDQERRLDLAMDNWMATAEQMIDTPAKSLLGLRVKATAVGLLVACFSSGVVNVEDRLARSLALDLLEGGGAA